MGKINELPKSSSHLLTSAQIITSVYCVVKELLENSLDSGSRNVEVKLEGYGLEKIEVKDNGCGIDKNDIQFVAKPHFTSKITSYSDLDKVDTYGFRGEALGAVCAIADLIVATKSSEENIGCIVNFGHDGQVISSKPYPCAQGTTVSVLNLFKNIPVRKQYYRSEKNKKDDLRKVEDLLVSYGCIQNDIRFILYHNKNLIWQKPALSSTKNALIHILGNYVVNHMKYMEHIDEHTQRKIEIYLPKLEAPLTCGFSNSSRCIIAINKRPVRIKAIDKLLKDFYNKAIQNPSKVRYPICYVSFTTSLTEVDVNVEPNKTTVMLHHSEEILAQFSEMLKKFYSIDIVNESNVNILEPNNSLPVGKAKPSASDFLNSLKVTCDSKAQQSKLAFVTESTASLVKDPVKKNCEIVNNNSLGNSKNSMTKRDIVEVSMLKNPCKKKLKTTVLCSKKDIDNHINTLKNFFSSEEQISGDKLINNSSNSINGMPTVTVQRVTSIPNGASSPETSKVVNGTESGRITTFTVISNNCSNNNSQSNNDSAGNRKRRLSDSSIPYVKLNEDFLKRPTIHINNQKEDAWSRGVHTSGELIQPVAILQSKSITTLESNPKISSENDIPKIKVLPEEKSLSFERKLTAFDIFCRNNRLEIAAQNPKFNNHQLAQILSEKWNHISQEEKAVYKNMVNKTYKQDIKKKERLGKIISQNLSQDKTEESSSEMPKMKKFKSKIKSKNISCSIEQIKGFYLNKNRVSHPSNNMNIINNLAPGIWVCAQNEKLYLLNTFRLQETIIYHRLLGTFEFDSEPLETPQSIFNSHLGDDAMATLMQLSNSDINASQRISDERLIANGFDISSIRDENNEVSVQLIGITNSIAFYGIPDLKELLLTIKEKSYSARLLECRPSKVVLYLQSEANRISRQSPACVRSQDVEDLLNLRNQLPANCNECIHHKAFFSELWKIECK